MVWQEREEEEGQRSFLHQSCLNGVLRRKRRIVEKRMDR